MDPWMEKQEKREMKKMKEYANMLGYVADAHYGIPTRCPCGGRIVDEVSPEPKYPRDRDWLPGMRYFTCSNFENDGLHFRQPWVIGVQEEIQRLRKQVDEMAAEIANLKALVAHGRD